MGMALLHPDLSRQHHYNPVNWPGATDSAQVAISISADSLCRLLKSHQLHVEDLTCLDAESRARVRQMLLDLVR
ncbi:hypothetical protein AQ621_04105 [Marinobacter sp. P4B1]|nr:hypothetical protein AQ621_04105 [Marinobacter sp. P4B1]